LDLIRRAVMKIEDSRLICKIHLRIASGALALAMVILAFTVAAQSVHAQTYTVLYTFTDGKDGGRPNAGLAVDQAGNLYGTTEYGGTGNGTVFKVDSAGNYSVLHTFTGADGSDPRVGVRVGPAGNLYGTAWIGALHGSGLVFEMDPAGNEKAIYNFSGGKDGAHPWSSLISDGAGNFYGATWDGGNETSCHSCGVVYKLTRDGKEAVLHTFNGGTDGANMVAGVVRSASGNLYGTTYQGGSGQCSYQAGGCGILFELDPSGNETILHTFTGQADGAAPFGGLVQDPSGNLYGTTSQGGAYNSGVVFEWDSVGNFSVLHSFSGPDGAGPQGDLLRDGGGNLYGTTALGGAYNAGTVFRLDPAGNVRLLHSFTGGADGGYPAQVRLLLYKRNLYGTTGGGGAGYGVVFKLVP
jgi:uncharacterized repeat protein (TIGR03803 family)